jgi:hypothetical protein
VPHAADDATLEKSDAIGTRLGAGKVRRQMMLVDFITVIDCQRP